MHFSLYIPMVKHIRLLEFLQQDTTLSVMKRHNIYAFYCDYRTYFYVCGGVFVCSQVCFPFGIMGLPVILDCSAFPHIEFLVALPFVTSFFAMFACLWSRVSSS